MRATTLARRPDRRAGRRESHRKSVVRETLEDVLISRTRFLFPRDELVDFHVIWKVYGEVVSRNRAQIAQESPGERSPGFVGGTKDVYA